MIVEQAEVVSVGTALTTKTAELATCIDSNVALTEQLDIASSQLSDARNLLSLETERGRVALDACQVMTFPA